MTANNIITDITKIITDTIPVEKIYLFGSFAYGNPDDNSDYDFFVIIPDNIMKPLEAIQKIRISLAKMERSADNKKVTANKISPACVGHPTLLSGLLHYEAILFGSTRYSYLTAHVWKRPNGLEYCTFMASAHLCPYASPLPH
jgi:predicted nucleotidyltransferase